MADQQFAIEQAVRVSHKHPQLGLGLTLVIGVIALLGLGTQSFAYEAQALSAGLPVVIAITVAVLQGLAKRSDKGSMQAVQQDELRQLSLQRAWRNGFLVALGLQPLLVVSLIWVSVKHEAAVMAVLTVLASLLWYDR
ncbi:hypothetical protein [Chitinimonas sp.]|uniref:hypothetical protein n=1 Tax=Chitinimonas sp. TaxID=1934313 RepID=UPI002F94EE52